jgi:glycosyltransferase involved in cell wall biosynthesis
MLKNKYDVVHCEDFEAALIGRILHIFWKKPKYVYDLHNRIVDNLRIVETKECLVKFIERIERWVIKCFDLIILNWRLYEKDPFLKKYRKFQLYDKANLSLEKYKLPTKKYVAYSGNYNTYQGVEVFLEGYAKSKHNFDVVLVGNVSDEVKDLVKELGIENKVHYTGFLDIRESNYILTNAIVCLIPKISEQHRGLKIVHHVMLGKISLATDIEANRELLKNGYNAILYKNNKELDKVLKKLDEGYNPEEEMQEGIKETQKITKEIWEYRYFVKNYFNNEER